MADNIQKRLGRPPCIPDKSAKKIFVSKMTGKERYEKRGRPRRYPKNIKLTDFGMRVPDAILVEMKNYAADNHIALSEVMVLMMVDFLLKVKKNDLSASSYAKYLKNILYSGAEKGDGIVNAGS